MGWPKIGWGRRPYLAGIAVLLLLLPGFTGPAAAADALPQPKGEVLLTVSGNIAHGNARGPDGKPEARFDSAMLWALGRTEISTHTPWHRGVVRFEGVLLRKVLAELGASGSVLHGLAYNDYSIDIPYADIQRYDVILALKANGSTLTVRDKGPVFVIYPYDTDAALRTDEIYSRSIWQLRRLEIR